MFGLLNRGRERRVEHLLLIHALGAHRLRKPCTPGGGGDAVNEPCATFMIARRVISALHKRRAVPRITSNPQQAVVSSPPACRFAPASGCVQRQSEDFF